MKKWFYKIIEDKSKVVIDNWKNKEVSEKFATILWYGPLTVVVLVIIIVVFIDWLNIWGIGHAWWNARFFNHFFVTDGNKFNWIGITSVLAIISLTFTAWDSRRKLKADLVSKSRVQWIKEARSAAGELLTSEQETISIYKSITYYSNNQNINDQKDTENISNYIGNMKVTLNDEKRSLDKSRILFNLYFPRKNEMEYSEKPLVDLEKSIASESDAIRMKIAERKYDYSVDSMQANLDKLTSEFEDYFKKEWQRVKRLE